MHHWINASINDFQALEVMGHVDEAWSPPVTIVGRRWLEGGAILSWLKWTCLDRNLQRDAQDFFFSPGCRRWYDISCVYIYTSSLLEISNFFLSIFSGTAQDKYNITPMTCERSMSVECFGCTIQGVFSCWKMSGWKCYVFPKKSWDLMSTGYVFPKKKRRFWSPFCVSSAVLSNHTISGVQHRWPQYKGVEDSRGRPFYPVIQSYTCFFLAHEDPWTTDISIHLYQWIISIISNISIYN